MESGDIILFSFILKYTLLKDIAALDIIFSL